MTLADIFPGLIEKNTKLLNKNPSWRKKGPGRRHNHLTAKQQGSKEWLMMGQGGMNATKALGVVRGH